MAASIREHDTATDRDALRACVVTPQDFERELEPELPPSRDDQDSDLTFLFNLREPSTGGRESGLGRLLLTARSGTRRRSSFTGAANSEEGIMKPMTMLAGIVVSTIAVTPQERPPQFDMTLKTTKLTDSLYLLEGAGGNVAVFVWDEGVLLVDDKLAPASADVKTAVAAITPKPIRFVVNSHWHRDHSGGNEAMATDGSVVVAHENVRRRMSVDSFVAVFGRNVPASPPKALPIVTFTRDVTFHLGDEEISVVHVDPAHTDGDSFVRFRKANFVHMGDCYLNGSFPVIDSSSGGLFSGTIAAADRALGMLDAGTRIIPGHGPIATAPELRQWRDMLETILRRVKTAAGAGKTLDQVKAERPAREWEGSFPRSFVTSDHVVEEAYRESAPR